MIPKRHILLMTTIASTIALAGCGNDKQGGNQTDLAKSSQPVTLKVVDSIGALDDTEFERYVVQPVKKKYPHITLQKIPLEYSVDRYEKLLASGEKPDIVFEANLLMDLLVNAKLTENMEPLIKKFNFDLNRLEPLAIESIKLASGGQYLAGIPYTRHFNALYYNRDIFDKFGVEYPKDGMTWDEVIRLAGRVSRTSDNQIYRGLDPDTVLRVGSILGQGLIDPKTEKPSVQTEEWKQVFTMFKTIYELPGYKQRYANPGDKDKFIKDRNVAMFAGFNLLPFIAPFNDKLNWDMASFPTFKEVPGKGTEYDSHAIIVTSISEHKDEAFKVVETLLSDEVQLNLSRNGKLPIVKDEKIRAEFGKDLPYLQGKNTQAIYKTTPATPTVITKHQGQARVPMLRKSWEVIKGTKDVNTALREAEEEISKIIEANK